MTQEEKQLLLKDLCARLPYGLKVQYTAGDEKHIDCGVDMVSIASECVGVFELGTTRVVWRGIEHIKPYLRPLSSMTEEEKKYYDSLFFEFYGCSLTRFPGTVADFLNRHMFDYRGLTPMGFALKAKEEMYKTQ